MANKDQRRFNQGDVIFREGEASKAAYVLIEGTVALTKEGDKGPVTLAELQSGELSGEMSLLDAGVRSATARAVGEVVVRIIPREEFLDALENEPDTARSVMGKLVERLRRANELAARAPAKQGTAKVAPPAPGQASARGLISLLFGLKGGFRNERIEVRVTSFAGDPDGERSKRVFRALSKRRGMRVRQIKETLELDHDLDLTGNIDAQLPPIAVAARRLLIKADADLLIWGEIPAPGPTMQLRFVPRVLEDENGLGYFGLATRLNLPVDFDDSFGDILFATVLAATAPVNPTKGNARREALPKAVEAARPLFQELPPELSSQERASINICFANALAAAGAWGAADLVDQAELVYRTALEQLARDSAPAEWGLIQKNLGAVLQAQSERTDDPAKLEAATDCYRNALQVLSKDHFPHAWAATHNRVGVILYKLDLKTGDSELVKHALAAFQSALQVYTRNDQPQRWSEVMGNVAQAALMLGEQLRNAEVLEKTADACRGVLEVRSRDKALLPWAATQNNLGSALFLLSRLNSDKECLEGAAEAFSRAREVYKELDAGKLAAVTEKNLGRVDALRTKLGSRSVPKMRWEEDDPS